MPCSPPARRRTPVRRRITDRTAGAAAEAEAEAAVPVPVPRAGPEPDPAQLRPVDVEFRCTVCGTTVVMTTAAGDDPEPPRHCREDMIRV